MSSGPPSAEDNNARMAMRMIQREVKRLLDQWDPLSLRGLPGFHEEYAPFVGPLAVMVRKGSPVGDIAAHLHRLVVEEWKLPPSREKCFLLAEKIKRVGEFTG